MGGSGSDNSCGSGSKQEFPVWVLVWLETKLQGSARGTGLLNGSGQVGRHCQSLLTQSIQWAPRAFSLHYCKSAFISPWPAGPCCLTFCDQGQCGTRQGGFNSWWRQFFIIFLQLRWLYMPHALSLFFFPLVFSVHRFELWINLSPIFLVFPYLFQPHVNFFHESSYFFSFLNHHPCPGTQPSPPHSLLCSPIYHELQPFSTCGSWTSSSSIAWELAKNANSQASSQIFWIRNFRWDPTIVV